MNATQVLGQARDATARESEHNDVPFPASAGGAEGEESDNSLVEEIRIDELSIDGMCGVY